MKVLKGDFGYIDYNRRKNGVISIVLIVIVLITAFVGRALFEKYSIYFAVCSALLILPTAQFMTQYILFGKYKSGKKEYFEKYQSVSELLVVLSDLIMVRLKKTAYFSTIVLSDDYIVAVLGKSTGLLKAKKINKEGASQLLNDILKPKGVNYKLEVFDDDEEAYKFINIRIKSTLKTVDETKRNLLTTIILQNSI